MAVALRCFPARVLSAASENDNQDHPKWLLPPPLLRDGVVVGHVHAAPDADGEVGWVLFGKEVEGWRYWALGLEAATGTRLLGSA